MIYPTTPNLGLPLVPDGDQSWGPAMRTAMSTLDDAVPMKGRVHVVAATGVLAYNATANLDVDFAESCDLISVASDHPAWIRVYSSDAARTLDATRAFTDDPTPGQGLMGEVATYAPNYLSIDFSPVPFFNNQDATLAKTAYLAITNMDPAYAGVINLDFMVLPQEQLSPSGPQGGRGLPGVDGNTVLYGTTDPTIATGVDGNFYINTATHTLFGPRAAGVWPAGTSLVGPAGLTGATGPAGTSVFSPMTTAGDLVYAGPAGAPTRLPIGAANYWLKSVGGNPVWTALTSSDVTTALGFTPLSAAAWGSITGASPQAAPAGGWTGNHGAMSMGALTATSGTFSNTMQVGLDGAGAVIEQHCINGWCDIVKVYRGGTLRWSLQDNGSGTGAVFTSAVNMGALSATTGTFSGALTATSGTLSSYLSMATGQKIYYATSADTNWSTGREASPTGAVLVTLNAIVNVAYQADNQGFLWRNAAGTSLLELTGLSGNMRVAGALSATKGTFSGSVSQTPVAFASLPTGSAGMRAFVNNNSAGAAFGAAADGLGSTTYPVYHDGVSWKVG